MIDHRRTADAASSGADGHFVAGPDAVTIWRVLGTVVDPELPFVSVVELGIVRDVERVADAWVVTMTPTYSGCPATQAIESDIGAAIAAATGERARVVTALAPPWTTDWIAPEARRKLHRAGIAPPHATVGEPAPTTTRPIAFHRGQLSVPIRVTLSA